MISRGSFLTKRTCGLSTLRRNAGVDMGVDMEKVMINIQKYGIINTSAGTIPICLWEWENQLKKGDNLILAAFGAGFTWGAVYLKWGYDGKKA